MATNYTNAQYPRDSLAYTEASATNTDYEEARPSTSPRSAASDVQLVPATAAASSSSGHQQGSSSAASPLSSGGSKRQFWTRRRRIFCFVCLGLIFVIAAVMIPVLIYVILPNIVQGNLNGSRFDFSAANFTQVTNDTVAFNLDMNIGNAGALPMDISFFSDLNVQYNGRDVLTVPKPKNSCKVSGGTCPIQEPFVATIKDQEGWTQFNKDLVLNRDFTWTISADVRVVVFNPITVAASMTKRPLGAQAFNNFNQGTNSPLTPQIRSIDFPGPNLSPFSGLNITLTTYINNPSKIEMPYGPAVLDLYLAPSALDPVTTLIGKVFTDSFIVKPGDNLIPFRGAILPIDPNKSDVQLRVSRLFDAFLQSRDTQMYLQGASQGSVDKFSDRVPYLENAIKNINLTAIFNGTDEQTLINTLTVGSNATIDLTVSNGTGATLSAGPVEGQFAIPFEFRYSLRTFTYDMELDYNGNKIGAITTGAINTTGASGNRGERRPFNSTFTNLSLRSENSTYLTNFQRWVADLTTSADTVSATFIGAADIGLNTEIGPINVTKLPIPRGSGNVGQLALRGLNGFRTSPRIVSLDLIAGNPNELTFNLTLALTNPSTVSMNYGDLQFYFNYTFAGASVNLGRAFIPSVSLPRGVETQFTTATVTYQPPVALGGVSSATPASNDFLSKYLNSGSISSTFSSILNETSTNPTIDYALTNVSLIDLPITTRNASLFPTTAVSMSLETLFTGTTNFRFGQSNPFGTALAWTEMRGNVTWTDNGVAYQLGGFDTGSAAGNFSTAAVPGLGGTGATDVVATLSLTGVNGPFFVKYALEATRAGTAPVRFSTNAIVAIGSGGIAGGNAGFTANLVYAQDARGSLVLA